MQLAQFWEHSARSDRLTGERIFGWLIPAYAVLGPLVVIYVGSSEKIGTPDLLLPLSLAAIAIFRRQSRFEPCHVMMWLFLAAALVSLLQITEPGLMLRCALRWVRLVAMTLPLFLALYLPVDERLVRRTMKGFIVSGLLAIFIALVLHWFQVPMRDQQQRLWFGQHQGSVYRAGGLVGNSGGFGHMVAVWALVATAYVLVGNTAPLRGRRIAAIWGLTAYTMVATASRGSVLNFLSGMTIFLLLARMTSCQRRHLFLFAAAAGMLLLMTVVLIGAVDVDWTADPVVGKLWARTNPNAEVDLNRFSSGRLKGWQTHLDSSVSQLLWGTGYKSNAQAFDTRALDGTLFSVLLETGVPGLLCLLGFIGTTLASLFNRYRRGNRYALILLSAWGGQCVHALTSDVYTFWLTMPVLYLLTGLVLSMPIRRTSP